MPRTISDRRLRTSLSSGTLPPSAQSLLLERTERRLSELEAENARLRADLTSARHAHSPLAFFTPRQMVSFALGALGLALAFFFFTLAHR